MGFEVLIPITAIVGFFSTIIAVKFLSVEELKHRGGGRNKQLEAELATLRQEMADLKTWANNLILSFDSTLQQQDARLQSVERRQLGSGGEHRLEARPEPEVLEVRTQV